MADQKPWLFQIKIRAPPDKGRIDLALGYDAPTGTHSARVLKGIRARAGVIDVRTHDLRHTFASADNKLIASLAGVAPMTRQSGRWNERARIRGGRRQIRITLYMPAVASLRCNPYLKKTFDTLSDAGKHAKLALTAVVRKLLIFANSLLRDYRKWNENRA